MRISYMMFLWLIIMADHFVIGSSSAIGNQAKAQLLRLRSSINDTAAKRKATSMRQSFNDAFQNSGKRVKEQWQRVRASVKDPDPNENVARMQRLTRDTLKYSGVRANGEWQRIRASTKRQAARQFSKAKKWLKLDKPTKINEDEINEKNFKELEDTLLSYFATDPDPSTILFELAAYRAARSKLKRNKAASQLDVPDKVEMRPLPIEPSTDYARVHTCTERCLLIYGYAFEVSPENISESEPLVFEAGKVIPITRGVITRKRIRNFIRQRDSFTCECITTEEFHQVCKLYNINPDVFDLLKKLSSKEATKYLDTMFENIGALERFDHESFVSLVEVTMMKQGLQPLEELERLEAFREAMGEDTEEAGEDYWQEMMFYRSPAPPSSGLPSPSILKKLKETGYVPQSVNASPRRH